MKIFPEPRRVASEMNTVHAVQPLSSTDFNLSLKQVKNAVAFDIPVGDKVFPPARVSRRLRKQKVAPERTFGDVKEKMRAAEERKLKELRRIREFANISSGVSKPHPTETFAQATAAKIAVKQAAAEKKRKEELEKKRQAGNRASRTRSRTVAAQTQLQSSIKRKVDETEQRKEKRQQKIDRQNKLREKHAKKVKDEVSINCKLHLSVTAQFCNDVFICRCLKRKKKFALISKN